MRVLTVPAPKPVQREPRRSGVGSQVLLRAAPPLQHAPELACHYPGLYLLTGAKPCSCTACWLTLSVKILRRGETGAIEVAMTNVMQSLRQDR